MSGIAVVHELAGGTPDANLGERMLRRVAHRGRGRTSAGRQGRTWLGWARGAGADACGGLGAVSVCDGQIYNREVLSERSPGWAPLGADEVRHLRGMFAFCALSTSGELVVARDRLGAKPLYWARRDHTVVLASEMGAFDEAWRPEVEVFPPGHVWSETSGLQQYAGVHPGPQDEIQDRSEALSLIRSTLVQAVRERLTADVPVGVFLSGGLDSSLVAAIMAKEAGYRVQSFAAGTHGSRDLAAARKVAEFLGLEHRERVYSESEVVAVLPEVVETIESYEPSLVRSAVPNHLLAQLAGEHVGIVLTGEGADELFAGYEHMRGFDSAARLEEHLWESLEGLHDLNLQRADRVTAAQGIEARVPFLAGEMISLAARIPIEWRRPRSGQREKHILREAFEGWLPGEVLWRRKEQFGDGSGTADVMTNRVDELAPGNWQGRVLEGLPPARSREEFAYQSIFQERLGGIRADLVLGRFTTA